MRLSLAATESLNLRCGPEAGRQGPSLLPPTVPLRRSASWSLVGNVVYSGSQWLIVALLAKLGSPEAVGQFALGLAVTAPVYMFASLQLRAIAATDSAGRYAVADYIGLRLATTAAALATVVGIALFYHQGARTVILVIGIAKSIEWSSDLLYGLLQRCEKLDLIACSMIAKGLLTCAVGGLLGARHTSALSVATALSIAWLSVLCLYDIPVVVRLLGPRHFAPAARLLDVCTNLAVLRPSWRAQRLTPLIKTSLPLGISMMLISLTTNVPRYYLHHFCGEALVGIFTALMCFGAAGSQIVMALGAAASPRMARYFAGREVAKFLSVVRKLLIGSAILGAAGVSAAYFAGPSILRICYRSEYSQYSRVFIWAMITAGVGYFVSILGYTATARWRFTAQPVALCAVIAALIVACHVLIPHYGLMGAVIACLVAQVVGLVSYGLIAFLPGSTERQSGKSNAPRRAALSGLTH